MELQSGAENQVLHFVCEHCQTSLTVDLTLAGVTGPCPSCGTSVTAPADSLPKALAPKPREVRRRAEAERPKEGALNHRGNSKERGGNEFSGAGRRRSVDPETGVSSGHGDRGEIAAIAKMLIAGLVVLGIVLAVAWWLNYRFDS